MLEQRGALLHTPTELRHQIFQYLIPERLHLRLLPHGYVLSQCLGPCEDGIWRDGEIRAAEVLKQADNGFLGKKPSAFSDTLSDPAWARRLQSSWGFHSRCEELVESKSCEKKSHAYSLLVCKKIYLDITTQLSRGTELFITDLRTIDSSSEAAAMTSPQFSVFTSLLLQVTRLSLVVKLPLQFYQILECADNTESELQSDIMAWLQIDSSVRALNKLRRLQVWLDHGDTCPWAVVHERAVLSPLIRLCETSSLKLSLSLPKLHPRFEDEARHFTGTLVPFHLHRRLRQRYHGRTSSRGSLEVIHKPDFPFLLDIDGYDDMSMVDVEEEEKAWWKEGGDVEREVNDINALRFHEYLGI